LGAFIVRGFAVAVADMESLLTDFGFQFWFSVAGGWIVAGGAGLCQEKGWDEFSQHRTSGSEIHLAKSGCRD
jgi:hypothetical protein